MLYYLILAYDIKKHSSISKTNCLQLVSLVKRIGHLDELTLEEFLKYFSNDVYDARRKKAVE